MIYSKKEKVDSFKIRLSSFKDDYRKKSYHQMNSIKKTERLIRKTLDDIRIALDLSPETRAYWFKIWNEASNQNAEFHIKYHSIDFEYELGEFRSEVLSQINNNPEQDHKNLCAKLIIMVSINHDKINQDDVALPQCNYSFPYDQELFSLNAKYDQVRELILKRNLAIKQFKIDYLRFLLE